MVLKNLFDDSPRVDAYRALGVAVRLAVGRTQDPGEFIDQLLDDLLLEDHVGVDGGKAEAGRVTGWSWRRIN